MFYISKEKLQNEAYSVPQSMKVEGMFELPDELLSSYIEYHGFVNLTVDENDIITAIECNQEALDAYLAELANQESTIEPTETEQLRADVDYIAVMTGVEL